MLSISSLQNPRVKNLVKLRESKHRRETQTFMVEGAREINRALQAGFLPLEVWFCTEVVSEQVKDLLESYPKGALIEVTKPVFDKIAVRENKDGLVAVFPVKSRSLIQMPELQQGLLLAIEGVEKPGNLGAMLRTADALGVNGVILLDQKTDLWNPIAIRASLGSIFNIPIYESHASEFKKIVEDHNFHVYAAYLSNFSMSISDVHFKKKSIILVGTEDEGLSTYWAENADTLVKIPMSGVADSLNVSVAASLFLFEAKRQIELL
jgi:TrmH family RNA methyltransferase